MDMKKLMMIMVLGAFMLSVSVAAQNTQEWKSTSSMVSSGSTYAPQVTEVGATYAPSEATTTESYSPAKAPKGPRRGFDTGAETGQSNESPIGDAVLPLLLMVAVYSAVRVILALTKKVKKIFE